MSAIAKDASITLITAVPGSGKTLRAVWYMRDAVKAGDSVFASNVNGLRVEGVSDFADPTRWEELPAGSVLVVDEAQKFFRAGREVPAYIAAMEEIRHRGVRLILLTQHPALIHGNIRALVGRHEHLVRQNGAQSVTVYTRSRVIDNVRSDKGLAAEDHHTWSYPSDCFDLYTSAEVHTVKRTIPKKYVRAAMLFGLAAVLIGGVVWSLSGATDEAAPLALSAPLEARQATGATPPPTIASAADYAKQLTPLVDGVPWTAPAWIGRPIVTDPRVLCIATGEKGKQDCKCYTEQATRFELDLDRCLDMARHGEPYNPYRVPHQSAPSMLDRPRDEGAGHRPADMAPVGAAPLSLGLHQGEPLAHYGWFRDQR